ncbi:MAG: alpha-glucan family phosphorylase [Actinobacteria bacterium]|nr:alpha-glucan family phosphorylase [Actinomycetota bacterium]
MLFEDLNEIAHDFAFSWHAEALALFERLDPEGFERVGRNPAALLHDLPAEATERLAADEDLCAEVRRIREVLAAERAAPVRVAVDDDLLVAYFSLEFGLHDSLRVYSGGLGILAGDHLKSASELGVPLVAVGLLYRHGYFRQSLDDESRQVERYPLIDPARLPLRLERGEDGKPLELRVEIGGARAVVQVWRAQVGRVSLFLLDAGVEENPPEVQLITSTLYGGDRELRIEQELLLGIGGVRALDLLGLRPTVFHMNEGHAALLALERIRSLVAAGRSHEEAIALVRASTVFTTHTPVPAGNEVFDPALLQRYLGPTVEACGFGWDEFLALGRARDEDTGFGLTQLALRTSARANGVSALHGDVSRRMWSALWPDRGADEVPIGHVTNGVHARTWLSSELLGLLQANGVRPEEGPGEQHWERALELNDGELWEAHRARKRALADRVVTPTGQQLDPGPLTIGFARRFATYKRAGLLFSQPERLLRLLGDSDRPVQLVIAGKAHPQDDEGKELIRSVATSAAELGGGTRIVFVEDYDMTLASHLVSGVDVWLNTPRRPLEASGTSGMKAGMNGVLNCSVLDGWWPEAYDPGLGWAIGGGFESDDVDELDAHDRESLFALLENEIVPAYYARGENGLPERWLAMMKASIAGVGGCFNTHRMVAEYVEQLYLPAHREAQSLQV